MQVWGSEHGVTASIVKVWDSEQSVTESASWRCRIVNKV